jgi:hypothetical protein
LPHPAGAPPARKAAEAAEARRSTGGGGAAVDSEAGLLAPGLADMGYDVPVTPLAPPPRAGAAQARVGDDVDALLGLAE